MDSVCRLCAKEKTPKQLGHSIDDRTSDVQQKLIDCCRWNSLVSIEYDTLPKKICNPCYRKLESSWSFAESVAQAQQQLLSMVGDEKPSALPPIEHVNISKDRIDSTDSTNAAVVLKQNEDNRSDNDADYHDDDDDDASQSSIEHDTFGVTSTTPRALASAPATTAGSSKSKSSSKSNKSAAAKKKPPAKEAENCDIEVNRKKSQKSPRSRSCICDTCGMELTMRENLQRHLKTHTNERNHVCKTCGKRFLRRNNLKDHENIHAGLKPYACDLCEYRCADTSNFGKHLRKKHGVYRKTEYELVEMDECDL